MMGSEFIKLKLVFLFHVFSQKKENIILLQNKRFRINLFKISKTLLSDTIFQMSTGAHRDTSRLEKYKQYIYLITGFSFSGVCFIRSFLGSTACLPLLADDKSQLVHLCWRPNVLAYVQTNKCLAWLS